MKNILTSLYHWQDDYAPSAYLLAFSGGRDSVALLHLLAHTHLSAPLRLCHVHHGWSTQADDWAAWCVAKAAQYGLPCEVVRIRMGGARGESREARARLLRYQALAARLPERGVLLTAHHQDDQAESFLLAALRGSGLQGLAAMPARKAFAQGEHWRPLLDVPRAAVDAYIQAYQLDFLDDPSNADTRLRRNALRHNVFPVLQAQGWQAEKCLAQSAHWLGEALDVQNTLLDALLPDALQNPVPFSVVAHDNAALERALLRRVLQRMGASMPPAPRLAEWLRQMRAGGGEPQLRWGAWLLIGYRGAMWLADADEPDPPPAFARDVTWRGVGVLHVTGECPSDAKWWLARGGMAFHARGKAHGKTLKDAFQKAGIPAALRGRTPVLASGQTVLWAGFLGCAQGFDGGVKWQAQALSASISAVFFSDADRA